MHEGKKEKKDIIKKSEGCARAQLGTLEGGMKRQQAHARIEKLSYRRAFASERHARLADQISKAIVLLLSCSIARGALRNDLVNSAVNSNERASACAIATDCVLDQLFTPKSKRAVLLSPREHEDSAPLFFLLFCSLVGFFFIPGRDKKKVTNSVVFVFVGIFCC